MGPDRNPRSRLGVSFLALLFLLQGPQTRVFAADLAASSAQCLETALEHAPLEQPGLSWSDQLLLRRKSSIAYPQTPDVNRLSICSRRPIPNWNVSLPLSAGLTDPSLERARQLHVVDDFKELSDLVPIRPLPLQAARVEKSLRKARGTSQEKALLSQWIHIAYTHPEELRPVNDLGQARWDMPEADPQTRSAFLYTEKTWSKLLREPHPVRGGSLLPSPYPIMIPAGRFQESYYWDSYFGNLGLIATGRLKIAEMQVENDLSAIRRYGFIPNGGRDYYLSRSQPPFISSMVRDVYVAARAKARTPQEKAALKRWLRERAYPLLKNDYENFWMKRRFDPKTGRNHYSDDVTDEPRPERHGSDSELALGKSFVDVRAAAESGLDFTDAYEKQASRIDSPILESMLFKTEKDLAWAAHLLGLKNDARKFEAAAMRRQDRINRDLWNETTGAYQPYLLGRGRVDVVTAETFAPLFVGAATPRQAARVRALLPQLERPGGIMASTIMSSKHQWDGNNGWAPFQVMAMKGLSRYGYSADARRIAKEWTGAIAHIFSEDKTFYERIDVAEREKPRLDSSKYPTQEGFLWTNGSFVWALVDVLKLPLSPAHAPE